MSADSEVAKAELFEDLVNLYERTKAEVRIPDKSGGRDRMSPRASNSRSTPVTGTGLSSLESTA